MKPGGDPNIKKVGILKLTPNGDQSGHGLHIF